MAYIIGTIIGLLRVKPWKCSPTCLLLCLDLILIVEVSEWNLSILVEGSST